LKVKTTRFGEIELIQEDLITFVEGIPGFPDEHEFVILPYSDDSPFLYLQSAAQDYLAFLMVNPFLFFTDYEFELDEMQLEELAIRTMEEVASYVMITVPPRDVKTMTANLVAPVVINIHTHQGKQIVLEKSKYQTKHLLFSETASLKGGN
jgi:flagellar assembly factor FliW